MQTEIKAIETFYAGCLFRSRLEARWAVFYDALGIAWHYEPEGFDLTGKNLGLYLPDFWLPEQKYLVEIKGQEPTPEETLKTELAAEAIGAERAFIFFGAIPGPDPWATDGAHLVYDKTYPRTWDCGHMWCICEDCHCLGVHYEGRSDRLPCDCPYRSHNQDRAHNPDHPLLLAAYAAARSARF